MSSSEIHYREDDPRVRLCYIGELRGELRSGRGKLLWRNGASYVGEWVDDRMEGHGVLTLRSGLRYTGQWVCGSFDGSGTMEWPSRRRYDGAWASNRRHGMGVMLYEAEDRRGRASYAGHWANGLRHGHGTMVWRGGAMYMGQWQRGKRHGFGEQRYSSGEKFEGHWKGGKRDGKGVKHSSIGSWFYGSWEGDRKHGLCAYVFFHGRIEYMQWHHGRFVAPQQAEFPPLVQTLQVLCLESLAAHGPSRRMILASKRRAKEWLLPEDLMEKLEWVFDHVILARKRSVSLFSRIVETYRALLSASFPSEHSSFEFIEKENDLEE